MSTTPDAGSMAALADTILTATDPEARAAEIDAALTEAEAEMAAGAWGAL